MEIRRLKEEEKPAAMALAWRVFQEFETPEYSQEGVETFRAYVKDREAVEAMTVYGALEHKKLVGVLALRAGQTHISLFFVDPAWHRKGVGKALFRHFLADSGAEEITVNASPYAVEVYRHLGFFPTASEQLADGIRYTPMTYSRTGQGS